MQKKLLCFFYFFFFSIAVLGSEGFSEQKNLQKHGTSLVFGTEKYRIRPKITKENIDETLKQIDILIQNYAKQLNRPCANYACCLVKSISCMIDSIIYEFGRVTTTSLIEHSKLAYQKIIHHKGKLTIGKKCFPKDDRYYRCPYCQQCLKRFHSYNPPPITESELEQIILDAVESLPRSCHSHA